MEKSSHREMEETVQFAELGKELGRRRILRTGRSKEVKVKINLRPLLLFHRKPFPLFKHVHCNERRLCFQHLRDDLQHPKDEPHPSYHSLFISSYFCLGCCLPHPTGL
ncbi:hypothetical protein IAS59_004935 [Cryptococcus gattii]